MEFPHCWSFLPITNIIQLPFLCLSLLSIFLIYISIPFSTMSLNSLSSHLFRSLLLLFFPLGFQFITSYGMLLIFIRWTCSYYCNHFSSIFFIVFVLILILALISVLSYLQSWCSCWVTLEVHFCIQQIFFIICRLDCPNLCFMQQDTFCQRIEKGSFCFFNNISAP